VKKTTRRGKAASTCARGARLLAEALSRENDGNSQHFLAVGLASVSSRIQAAQASQICEGAVRDLLTKSPEKDEGDRVGNHLAINRDVSVLLPLLDTDKATGLARESVTRICSEPFIETLGGGQNSTIGELLNALLSDTGRPEMARRASRMAIKSLAGGPLAASLIAAEPFPCRLTTQELVELLKMPTCIGKARRVVLDHLGIRYSRRFFNHWEFVRFAEEQNLGLDFTTPPKRPDPRESVKRMLEILDGPGAGR
jgi:hypothetical protein